jgi:hypothetical protein
MAQPNARHEAARTLAKMIAARGGYVISPIPPVPPDQDRVRFEAPTEIAASIAAELARTFAVEPAGSSTRVMHSGIVETITERSSDGIERIVEHTYPGIVPVEQFVVVLPSSVK